jgi:hypothetical protein
MRATIEELWEMLQRNWEAWDDEEDSVKEEHQELIDDLEALLDRAPPEERKS